MTKGGVVPAARTAGTLRDCSRLSKRRLNVCAGLEVNLDDRDAIQRLRLDMLNVVDQSLDAALDVGVMRCSISWGCRPL